LPAVLVMLVVFAEGQFSMPQAGNQQPGRHPVASLLDLDVGPIGAFLSSPLLIVGLILNERLRRNGSG